MPRIDPELQRLQEIKTLPSLIKYLKDDLNWPIGSDDVESVVFDYDPAELGFDSASTAKIEEVCQLRPLTPGQKWGVFWVKFGKKQLPVQMLRRALGNLVVKKRTSTKKADKAAWHMHDLLFISAYGDDSNRHITFAHFSESEDSEKSLPVLKVLSWDEDDTLLHLKDTYKSLVTCLNWETTPTDDPEAWREHWSKAFKLTHKEVINTTKELVVELAHLATVIKKSVLTSINAETEKGPWKKLMLAFQKTLIKDLNEEQFADVIAQTISYGLLTARLSSDGQISLKNLVDMVPSTNPFLKELLQHFLTSAGMKGLFDVDEAGINDVVELLNRANAQAIRNDFGKKTDGEDPVIHFYEHFLGAYNKKLKVERGVFYTPQPIVSYIVRSVHELLQNEFGLEDGLADTSTWADVKKRHKDLKIPEGINPEIEPFVQILDPATGTATFLIEVIEVIHNTMTTKWEKDRASKADQAKKWNTYVPTYLLPRLYAYELMMAPYAIAHMKVGLKLTETGFTAWEKLGPENRANIFLTNALEPWAAQLDLPGFNALAHESAAVNEVKKNKYFTVVIGNPPYSNFGKLNKNTFILSLLEDYKKGLDERKINLDDDFIKFVRYSQYLIEKSATGVVGMITNSTFLDGVSHRKMRADLVRVFPVSYFLNLHGNTKRKETPPNGEANENVFDIMQGVSISLMTAPPAQKKACIGYFDAWGTRTEKYKILSDSNIRIKGDVILDPKPDRHFLIPKDFAGSEEYESWLSLTTICPLHSLGIETSRDEFAIAYEKKTVIERVEKLRSKLTDSAIRAEFGLDDKRDWDLPNSRKKIRLIEDINALIRPIQYRPFDTRYICYSDAIVTWPRHEVLDNLLQRNLALICVRNSREDSTSNFFCVRHIVDKAVISSRDNAAVFPLYRKNSDDREPLFANNISSYSPNLSPEFIGELTRQYGETKAGDVLPAKLTPEDIFSYTYAVFHSPTYRSRYAEFLKIDFPRLPLTRNIQVLRTLVKLGDEIISLHSLDAHSIKKISTEHVGSKNIECEKPAWFKNTVWIDKAQTTGFKGVKEEVWNFHIGGYQVCEKWLKDRKGRKLTKDDIEHYQKIVVAISETIRLMAEIDKVIDEHGGWPGAFQAAK